MSRKGGQSSSRDIGLMFFTNLQLLGFDSAAMSAMYSIPFNRDMFKLPNKKGYEVVVHFLFSRLNLTMCREQFRDCWPIATKKAEQEFNKTVTRWLTDISKEEPDSNLPRILPSLFHSPGGEKFRRLLFHFSTFVVKRCIKQEQGVRDHEIMKHPMLTPNTTRLSGVMRKAVMCNSIRHRKRFFTVAQESLIAHKHWKDYASELVKDYRKVSKTIRELEHQLRDARQKAEERATAKGSPHMAGKALAMKRAQHVQQVRAMWKEVEKFSSEQSAEKEVVESIFQSVNSQYQIDGREINLNVPELLLRKCQNEIQRRRVENTYEGGKLNLLSLLQLWNLSLHLYIEKLREVGIPELDVAPISTVVHTYHAQLANLETLKERLSSELIPNLRGSVDDVRSKLPVWDSEYASPSNRQAMPMQLTIPSPLQISMTPDLSKKATPPEFRTRVTPKADANTPDTVIQLIDSVEKAARKSKSTHDRIHITRGQPKRETTKDVEHEGEATGEARKMRSHLPTRHGSKHPAYRRRQPPGNTQSDVTLNRSRGRHASGERTSPEGRWQPPADEVISPEEHKLTETQTPQFVSHSDLDRSRTRRHISMNQQPHDVFDSPSSHTNGYSTTAKPQVHRSSSSVRRTPVRSALDILADKIASAVIRESPLATDFKDSTDNTPTLLTPDFNLDNPADAMDESVFASRDLIGRSPVGVFISSHTPYRPVTSDTEAHLRTSEFRSFLIEEDEDKENEIDKFDIQRDKERLSKTETEVYHRCNNDKPQVIRGTMDHVDTSDDNMDSVPPGLELSPSPSPVVPEKPSHKPGSGDFEDDSVFVPVQEGLQYTSPYRPKMSGQAESLHEKIERYKQLRSTILSNVTSQKSPVKQEMIEEIKAMSSPGFSRNPDDPVQHLYISDQDDALGCEEAKHSPVDTTKNHWVSHTPERQYRLTPAHREELYSLQVDDLLDLNTSKTDFSSSDGRPHTTARLSTSLQDFSMGKKMEEDFLHEEPFSKNHLIPFDLDLDIEGDSQGMSRIGPLKTQSPNNSSRADRHVTFSPKESPDSYKQLFSLDVEDLDFGDVRHSKETEYGAKSSPTHAGKSPILDDSCLFLDSSLNLEGSFLVS